jgi:hypothetical protein
MELPDLPALPPPDVSPYDCEDVNGPSEYAWYERSMQAYAREYGRACALVEREKSAKVAESYKDYHGSYSGRFSDAAQYHALRSEVGSQIAAAIRSQKEGM